MDVSDAMREFVKQNTGDGLIVATVLHVTDDYTFDCEDLDGNEYLDVRMNAVPANQGLIVTPFVESTVLIMDLGNLGQEYVLVQASEIAKVQIVVDESTEVLVDNQSIQLGINGAEPAVLGEELNTNLQNLLDELSNMITHLDTFCTTQGAAATGTLAPLAAGYTTLKASLATVQTAVNALENDLPNHNSATVSIAP